MVTMAQSAVNWRNTLVLHAFTHTLTSTQLQPHCVKHQLNFSVHAGSFHVSCSTELGHGLQDLIMRTWSVLCICIHMGVRHTDSESAQKFWIRKTHKFFLCSRWDSNLGPLDLESDALPIEPPRHPIGNLFFFSHCYLPIIMQESLVAMPNCCHTGDDDSMTLTFAVLWGSIWPETD